jgi:hypothetical protein
MTAPDDIAALLWDEGIAPGSLASCVIFIMGYERTGVGQSPDGHDLLEAAIRPLAEVQAVSSPESFRWALKSAIEKGIWAVPYVRALALMRDGLEWEW